MLVLSVPPKPSIDVYAYSSKGKIATITEGDAGYAVCQSDSPIDKKEVIFTIFNGTKGARCNMNGE